MELRDLPLQNKRRADLDLRVKKITVMSAISLSGSLAPVGATPLRTLQFAASFARV